MTSWQVWTPLQSGREKGWLKLQGRLMPEDVEFQIDVIHHERMGYPIALFRFLDEEGRPRAWPEYKVALSHPIITFYGLPEVMEVFIEAYRERTSPMPAIWRVMAGQP